MATDDADPGFDDGWVSQTFCEALDGNRTSALAMWRRIADGATDSEARMFMQAVAQSVVEADRARTPSARRVALVAAIRLSGREDRHRELRSFVRMFNAFEDLTCDPPQPVRDVNHARLIAEARERGLIPPHYKDDYDALQLIRRVLRD